MRSPEEVFEFLDHEDGEVVDLAKDYLRKVSEPSPVTAQMLLERLPEGAAAVDDPRFEFVAWLPQTEQSIWRLLELAQGKPRSNALRAITQSLDAVGPELLPRVHHAVTQSTGIDWNFKRSFDERLRLLSLPTEALWEGVVGLARRYDQMTYNEMDRGLVQAYIRTLGMRPEAADHAMELLEDPHVIDWRKVFAIRILGWLRHLPAVPTMRDLLENREEDEEAIYAAVSEALARIGDPDAVVGEFVRRSPTASAVLLGSMSETLGKLRRPDAELALIEIFQRFFDMGDLGEDEWWLTIAAIELAYQCPTEPRAFELLRRCINEDRYNPMIANMRALTLAAATIAGVEIAEAEQWKQQAALETQRLRQRYRELLGSSRRGSDVPAIPERWLGESPGSHRRAVPKVGRNDPCPCGSGRKYKKCCEK